MWAPTPRHLGPCASIARHVPRWDPGGLGCPGRTLPSIGRDDCPPSEGAATARMRHHGRVFDATGDRSEPVFREGAVRLAELFSDGDVRISTLCSLNGVNASLRSDTSIHETISWTSAFMSIQ